MFAEIKKAYDHAANEAAYQLVLWHMKRERSRRIRRHARFLRRELGMTKEESVRIAMFAWNLHMKS